MSDPASLANAMAKQLGFAPKDGKHCVKCRVKYRFTGAQRAHQRGDVYSGAGRNEALKFSGLCEFCYDNLFGE